MFRSVSDLVSSSSSVNTSKSYISDMTWPILTRLGHKYRLTIPFMSHDQIRVKGHVGVTGVKKVIFTKNATPPTNYVAWLRLMYVIELETLYKSYFLKCWSKVIWGHTGGKSNFHFSWIHSSILKKDMSLFHLSNDVQCSETLIRIKRLAAWVYRLHYSADCRPQAADCRLKNFKVTGGTHLGWGWGG